MSSKVPYGYVVRKIREDGKCGRAYAGYDRRTRSYRFGYLNEGDRVFHTYRQALNTANRIRSNAFIPVEVRPLY